MDIKKYIASGILELYVAGLLSEKENSEVHDLAMQYPEIKAEIEAIEKTILAVSKTVSPGLDADNFERITSRMGKVVNLQPAQNVKKSSWANYLGWAASLLLAVGLVWMYLENNRLESEIEIVSSEKELLEERMIDIRNEVANTEEILNQLRDQDVAVVALGGQTVAPKSYAKAYWNKVEKKVYIDAQGLPEPPPGYTYQVWSLKLNPLTPTSIGLLDDFANNDKRLFELPNPNESEAFGITLEPEGGSETPTLEQLYTLGAVPS